MEKGNELIQSPKKGAVQNIAANEKLLQKVNESLKGIKFGHVLIMVHNGKIVQIDRTEKNRCELNVVESDGGGINNHG
jgi:hypothetical protein